MEPYTGVSQSDFFVQTHEAIKQEMQIIRRMRHKILPAGSFRGPSTIGCGALFILQGFS